MRSLIAVLLLAGCGNFTGSPHGYIFDADLPWGFDATGVPTVTLEGTRPMGYRSSADGSIEDVYTTYDDSVIRATGRAAWIVALARLCGVVPRSAYCGSTPPGE